MKKKYLFLLFTFVLVLFVAAACGDDGDQEETENTNNESAEPETGDENAEKNNGSESENANENEDITENKEEEADEETNEQSELYFKDNVAKLRDLKIEITDTKVIPVGETGNEYGDQPVLAIWYKTTNLSEKDINPTTAWLAVFEAVQDNDPNAVNTLDVGSLPDSQFRDSQLQTIKQDGTVENAVAYKLDDLETPVTLIATQGIMGEKLGEQVIEIK
ncbi:DUF5067 domain-containing protein [Salirhabdus sp. Marseille-P4669]|uniref:DUF5067 domain-containing protein n=1 Tax=Salirhabdus sp. Marseille-P4669 TaxID=2042310 RepID=UPI000C7B9A78|nr:DUF5067 domain-containing protein [Salirhabdus sp. Marseille-P4669]